MVGDAGATVPVDINDAVRLTGNLLNVDGSALRRALSTELSYYLPPLATNQDGGECARLPGGDGRPSPSPFRPPPPHTQPRPPTLNTALPPLPQHATGKVHEFYAQLLLVAENASPGEWLGRRGYVCTLYT